MHSLCIDENTYMMLKIKESLYYTHKKVMNLIVILFLKHFDKFGRGLKIFSVRPLKYCFLFWPKYIGRSKTF